MDERRRLCAADRMHVSPQHCGMRPVKDEGSRMGWGGRTWCDDLARPGQRGARRGRPSATPSTPFALCLLRLCISIRTHRCAAVASGVAMTNLRAECAARREARLSGMLVAPRRCLCMRAGDVQGAARMELSAMCYRSRWTLTVH